MEALWNALKSLAPWQIFVLAAVMLGSAGAVFLVSADQTQPTTTELTESQQLIPIRYGDIVNQVSTNGNLAFPEREQLSFGIKGAIGELLVEEGQQVAAGQPLVRLDAPTLATLAEAAAQARVDQLAAEEALADLLAPPEDAAVALERATAEEQVANARYQVRLAHDALDEALAPSFPSEVDLKSLEEEIAATQLLIQQRKEEREDLLNPELPSNQAIRAQEELIADSRLKLQQAIDAHDELVSRDLEPDYRVELTAALQQKAEAQQELDSIEEALADTTASKRQLLEARQSHLKATIALDEANRALEDFRETWGSDLTTRRQEKAELEADLAKAQTTLVSLREDYDNGAPGLEYHVNRWEIYIQNLEEELEQVRFGLVSQEEELEAEVSLAEAALEEAEQLLQEVEQGEDILERSALEARSQTLTANIAMVDRDLAELEPPEVDPQELALSEARVVLAEANLNQAVEDLAELLEELKETPDGLALELNSRQLELAQATLLQLQDDYAAMLEEFQNLPDPLEVALRREQLALAKAGVVLAGERLDEQQAPPDPLDLALAEQKVAAAQVQLATAQAQLESATLAAPIGGYVAELLVAAGDEVEARTVIIEIVDPSIVEIDGIVDEIDVLLVEVGTSAEVRLDALPDVNLRGVVTEIAEEAQNQQGVVTFPLRIRMEVPDGVRPREGLSAVANIVLQEERNVLLVPQQALYGSFDQPAVRVMTAQGVSEVPVTLGSSDDFWVSVESGLSEGDQIIIESSDLATSEFSFRNLRRATGGSFGPSRGGGPRR